MICCGLQLHQSYRALAPRAGLCLTSTGAMNTRWPTDTTDDAIATQTFATVLPGELWWRWPVLHRFYLWPLFECLQTKDSWASVRLYTILCYFSVVPRQNCTYVSPVQCLVLYCDLYTVIRVHFVKLLQRVSLFHPSLLLCNSSSSSLLPFTLLLWPLSLAGEYCELCQNVQVGL